VLSPRPPEAGKMPIVFIWWGVDGQGDVCWLDVVKRVVDDGGLFMMVCQRNRSRCRRSDGCWFLWRRLAAGDVIIPDGVNSRR